MASKRPQVPQMRGVTDLFSMEVEGEPSTSTVPISKILLSKHQPRRYFDPEKLAQLTQSVKEHGILEPLLVRPSGSSYELIAGERRYRAAQTVGLTEVPVVVREFDDRQALQVALIENLQRDDLNPVEETEGILQLLAIDLNATTGEVVSLLNQAANAKKRGIELTDNVIRQVKAIESLLSTVGRFNAESFRVNRLPLLNLPDEVLAALREGKLEFTKARVIARVKDGKQRQEILEAAISEALSLIQIKERIHQLYPNSQGKDSPPLKSRMDEAYRQMKQSKIWSDPKRQKQLEKVVTMIETLISENS